MKKEKIATVILKKNKWPKDGALVLLDRADLIIAGYPLKFSGKGSEVATMRDKVNWFFKRCGAKTLTVKKWSEAERAKLVDKIASNFREMDKALVKVGVDLILDHFPKTTTTASDDKKRVRMVLCDAGGEKWLAGPSHPDCLWRIDGGVWFVPSWFSLNDESRFGLLNLLDLAGRKELVGPIEKLTLEEVEAERMAS